MHGACELWSGSVGLRVDTGHLTDGISPGHQSVTVAAEGTWFVQFVLLAPMRRESDEVAACRAGSPLQLTGTGTRAQQVRLDAGIYGVMTSVRDNGTDDGDYFGATLRSVRGTEWTLIANEISTRWDGHEVFQIKQEVAGRQLLTVVASGEWSIVFARLPE